MFGMRHPHGRRSGRPAFLLALLLALLALAVFPVLAQADSGGAQYETALPTVTGHESTPTHSKNSKANSSDTGGATASESENSKESKAGSSSSDPSAGGGGGTAGGGDGTGQGSPANAGGDNAQQGGNNATAGGIEKAQPISNPSNSSDDGSSSPLIPILIAIALLAAISVGAVVYRQRRQRPGSTISPKAS